MNLNHRDYAKFNYKNSPSEDDTFELGDVVMKPETKEIGVIIQCHGNNEYRTDMFGNCSYDEKYGDIRKANVPEVKEHRPELLEDLPHQGWITGKYDEGEIDFVYSTVSFGDFFAQGYEAEQIITAIHTIWIEEDVDQQEAVTRWVSNYL